MDAVTKRGALLALPAKAVCPQSIERRILGEKHTLKCPAKCLLLDLILNDQAFYIIVTIVCTEKLCTSYILSSLCYQMANNSSSSRTSMEDKRITKESSCYFGSILLSCI
jgi:hypothetical protein